VEDDLKIFHKAISSRNVTFWKEVVNDKMDSILSNNIWVLVNLPSISMSIGCKYVLWRKYNVDGSIQTFKVRLVAKDCTQKEGIVYFDSYSLMARITFIRVLFVLVLIYKLYVHQMDIKMTFLNGDLKEKAHIKQPEVFILLVNEIKIYKLVNSLYYLK